MCVNDNGEEVQGTRRVDAAHLEFGCEVLAAAEEHACRQPGQMPRVELVVEVRRCLAEGVRDAREGLEHRADQLRHQRHHLKCEADQVVS
eukprot:2170379-Pyramimonas_sp.AAC.3